MSKSTITDIVAAIVGTRRTRHARAGEHDLRGVAAAPGQDRVQGDADRVGGADVEQPHALVRIGGGEHVAPGHRAQDVVGEVKAQRERGQPDVDLPEALHHGGEEVDHAPAPMSRELRGHQLAEHSVMSPCTPQPTSRAHVLARSAPATS